MDHTENIIKKNLLYCETLHQTILKQAFEGNLVPQDPSDEPAEILLERIKQDKAKSEIHANPKKTKIKHDHKQMRLV
jgi:type I restriction enzyme S subunit